MFTPGIHTATTSPCLVTRQNFIVALFSDTQGKSAPRHLHSHDKSVFSDTAKRSVFSDVAAYSIAKKKRALRYSYSRDKSVFRDKVKKSAFNDAAVFSDAQKRRAPRHSHRHNIHPCSVTR